MTAPDLYLTRARIRRDLSAPALRMLLAPTDDSTRAGAGHKVIWALFDDRPDRRRDFLWREAEPGLFYVLSSRAPEDRHQLFDLDPPKPFVPDIHKGDLLRFSLRANATVARSAGKEVRGQRSDVVMDALYRVPKEARALERTRHVTDAGLAWLARQAACSGFALPTSDKIERGRSTEVGATVAVHVTAYRTLQVEHRGPRAKLGVLDFEGLLEVTDPGQFLKALGNGFGRAKAFGCGLMLIRRARMV